ncbi:DoxX family protein [Nocardia sp. GCM10030253]|uniref:DoxX family protein n=1 Tax=Nocardia sp. GCM10030253 TaxID=3273404 RepID=UPI0036394CA1
MGAVVSPERAHGRPQWDSSTDLRWHPITRVGFRMCVAYFGLFCLVFAQITFVFAGIAGRWLPEDAILWQMQALDPVTGWVGRQVFGVDAVLHDSGSGDQAVIWVLVFCLLVVAAVITALWTALDRGRSEYTRSSAWFLVFIRLCLAGQMIFYGMAKVIPTQMSSPPLAALLQPYGEFSPMSVLWMQVGSSHPYEILLGSAEVLGGLLLFLPRTATLGAMLSLVSLAQVFVLNMTFDVPVKILSFHLVLLCLVVLAPQARRLANVLVLERPSEPATQPRLFRSRRAERVVVAVQIFLGIWVLLGCVRTGWDDWHEYGDGAPKPPLYGIWNVTEFDMDGVPLPPLTTEENRWQRLVFDTGGAMYQRMDGSRVPVVAVVDPNAETIVLSEPAQEASAQPNRFASFTFEQPGPDRLVLRGLVNDRPVTVSLDALDLDSFPLRSRGFHWIQDYPYFR